MQLVHSKSCHPTNMKHKLNIAHFWRNYRSPGESKNLWTAQLVADYKSSYLCSYVQYSNTGYNTLRIIFFLSIRKVGRRIIQLLQLEVAQAKVRNYPFSAIIIFKSQHVCLAHTMRNQYFFQKLLAPEATHSYVPPSPHRSRSYTLAVNNYLHLSN